MENVGSENFFRKFGNPAVIRTKAGERCVMMSPELYDRVAERCGLPGTAEMIREKPKT